VILLWLIGVSGLAVADGIHTGVPIQGVEGVGPPSFQTSTTGWTAPVDEGFVRVYVAPHEAGAKDWVNRMRETMARFKPAPNPDFVANSLADEAYGDGAGLLIFRDGNVGVQVRNKKDAIVWAEIIQLAISDDPVPWPAPARLVPADGLWTVQAPADAAHIAFEGGRLARHQGLTFTAPPRVLVVWDQWGRAVRTELQSPDVSEDASITVP
jgi:hypothetical protein